MTMHQARYLRLCADAQGESHFEEIAVDLALADFAPPSDPVHVAALFPTTACGLIGSAADWDGGSAHPTPHRQLLCTLRGAYEVTASDGTVRRFPVGSLLLLDDTTGKGHLTRSVSDDEMLVLSVTLAP
jgi:hypothetical protein